MLEKIKNRSISSTESLLAALKQMDAQKVKMLFVFDKQCYEVMLAGRNHSLIMY